MSLPAEEIDKAVLIGALASGEISGADYISFYDSSAEGQAKQRKISFSDFIDAVKTYITGLPAATAADAGKSVHVDNEGNYILSAAATGQSEYCNILPDEWNSINTASPFEWYADKTLQTTIQITSTVELINNDPITMVKYGIALANPPMGQVIRFYAINQPTSAVIMKVNIYG